MAKRNGNGKSERIHVLELRARNIKCVKEVAISFDGALHDIRGDAGQGKSTILAAIEGGLRGIDPDMVRNGAKSCELELHLTAATINRVINKEDGKETLMVTDSEGNAVEKASEFLKTICGPTVFRPVEWVQLGGGEKRGRTERLRRQRDQLLEAIPMSLSDRDVVRAVSALGDDAKRALGQVNLDDVNFDAHPFVVCSALEKACYEFRKLQNSKAEDAEEALKHHPAPERVAPDASAEECAAMVERATEAFHEARAQVGNRDNLARRRDELRARIESEADLPDRAKLDRTLETYRTNAAELKGRIEDLEEQLQKARDDYAEVSAKVDRCEAMGRRLDVQEARVADLAQLEEELQGEGPTVDLEELRQDMEDARAALEARRMQDVHDDYAASAEAARAYAERFDALVKLFRDDLPKRLLGEAELPVDGLSFDERQILIDGVPLHQLGTSQQIRIGVLIAAALNPRAGFVLVDGAESLGTGDRKALAEAAAEHGLQLIMTYVDPGARADEHTTVMEAGAVKGGNHR